MKMTKTIDTREQKVGQNKEVLLNRDTDAEAIRDEFSDIEVMDTPHFKDKADNLLFMEEYVEVMVHSSTDKNAEKVVDVYVNGTPQRFIRGRRQVVRRKFVESLARAKPFGVATPEATDDNGDKTTKIVTSVALRYPFDMRDKNPRGVQWLQSILQEA
jgi:hypothetical protein